MEISPIFVVSVNFSYNFVLELCLFTINLKTSSICSAIKVLSLFKTFNSIKLFIIGSVF